MDAVTLGQALAVADKVTAVVLVMAWMIAGAKGTWYWAGTVKDKDNRIAKLEQKIEAQERLIDRLSGVADRSIGISTAAVVHQVREQRASAQQDVVA